MRKRKISAQEFLNQTREWGIPDWAVVHWSQGGASKFLLTPDGSAVPLPGVTLASRTLDVIHKIWFLSKSPFGRPAVDGVPKHDTADILVYSFNVRRTHAYDAVRQYIRENGGGHFIPASVIPELAKRTISLATADNVWKPVRNYIQSSDPETWAAASGTQKIKGLRAVNLVSQLVQSQQVSADVVKKWYFAKAKDYLGTTQWHEFPDQRVTGALPPKKQFPLFVRPCPTRPRHGFVDSQPVHDHIELQAVAQAAYESEPDAELLLTSFIEGERSAILTPNSLSVGAGHDGATGGKSLTIYGPALPDNLTDVIREQSDISPGDVPYVELVQNSANFSEGKKYNIVQVRGGPPVEVARDFVPEATDVREVITARPDLDLVAWEKTINEAEPGTVVYAPGLSLASHFCVHAVVNNVPVITTYEPKVGERLEPNNECEWTKDDWKRLAQFSVEADKYLSDAFGSHSFAKLSVLGLHFAGQPAPASDQQLRLLAYGSAAAAKFIASTCIGEARHVGAINSIGPAYLSPLKDKPILRARRAYALFKAAKLHRPLEREDIYKHSLGFPISDLTKALKGTSYLYNYVAWASAYGGRKWAGINAGARKLCLALTKFQRGPGPKTWAKVVEAWNVAINREHNGGAPAIGKFGIRKDYLTEIQTWPCGYLLGLGDNALKVVLFGPDREPSYRRTYEKREFELKLVSPFDLRLHVHFSVDSTDTSTLRLRTKGAYGELDALLALAEILNVNEEIAEELVRVEPAAIHTRFDIKA